MRRLNGFRGEEGVSAVLLALLVVPLLAMAALVIDVGMMYWEVRQLQNGADAAAIAIAQECADSEATCAGAAQGIADRLTDDNANDQAASAAVDLNVGSRIVTVTAGTMQADGTDRLSLFFARILNAAPQNFTRSATAIWGPAALPETSIPLTISECEYELQEADGSITILIKGDGEENECLDDNNPGMYEPGGFGWLDPNLDGCAAEILPWTSGNTGNSPPTNECNHTNYDWQALAGQRVAIPFHNGTNDLPGNNTDFQMAGVGYFEITHLQVGGGEQYTAGEGACPGKSNKERCLIGRFVDYVDIGNYTVNPVGEDFGLIAVQLVG